MTDQKKWRDAKMPQWVKDAIDEEMKAIAIHGALSWPTEEKPEPLPFYWTAYDRLEGSPIEGSYWTLAYSAYARPLHIRKRQEGDNGMKHKTWSFSNDGVKWSTDVQHGPIFSTKRDAVLYRIWELCEKAASELYQAKRFLNHD